MTRKRTARERLADQVEAAILRGNRGLCGYCGCGRGKTVAYTVASRARRVILGKGRGKGRGK